MSIFLLLKVFILCYICNYTWLFFLHLVYIVSLHQFFNLIGLVSHKSLNMLIFPISLIATLFSITPSYCFLWACFLDSFLESQVLGFPFSAFLLFWYSPMKYIPPPSVIGWGCYLHIWVVSILKFPFSLVLCLVSPLYIFLNAYFWLCWKLSALVLSLIYTRVLSHWLTDEARSCSCLRGRDGRIPSQKAWILFPPLGLSQVFRGAMLSGVCHLGQRRAWGW